ncbi:MAG: sigma-70 family RNA polymerase sigma factor [Planctomycetota bacterium]
MTDRSSHADRSEVCSLVRRSHGGHGPSAARLHSLLAPRLYVLAEAVTRDAGLAEDAVQNAFCTLLELSRREVRYLEDPSRWLATVARREALMMLRSRRRRLQRERAHASRAVETSDADRPSMGDAIRTLPRQLREIVVLKHAFGFTFDQVSLSMGISRSSAVRRYERARTWLRDILDPGDAGIEPSARQPGMEVVSDV